MTILRFVVAKKPPGSKNELIKQVYRSSSIDRRRHIPSSSSYTYQNMATSTARSSFSTFVSPLMQQFYFQNQTNNNIKYNLFQTNNNTIRGDFCSELIPSSTIFAINKARNGRIRILGGVRNFSNNNNNKSVDSTKDGKTKETDANLSEHNSPNTLDSSSKTAETTTSSSSSSTDTEAAVASEKLREIVNSVGPRLKQVRDDINPGDLVSVVSIVTLIAIIVVAPTVIRHMRRSDNTYEDIDPEDPYTHIAKTVEEEIRPDLDEYLSGGTNNGSSGGRKSGGSGLDSLVADLLNSPQIQQAVNNLIVKLLQSPEVKQSAQLLLKELWNDLVNDPETLQQIIHLLRHAIQDEQIKEASIQLVTEVFSDKEISDELVDLVQKLGQEKQVQVSTQQLLVESAHNALNDPEILDHSMEFATDVVGDDVVQQTAGEALYNTLAYAITPTLSIVLSAFGVGLIVLSFAALRNATSSNPPPPGGDGAALLQTLESTKILDKIWKVLTFPLDVLVSTKDGIVWLVTLPFRLVSKSYKSLEKAGNATLAFVGSIFQWVVSLPSNLFHSLLNLLGTSFNNLSSQMNAKSNAAWAAISNSFVGIFIANVIETFSSSINGTMAVLSSTQFVFENYSSVADDYIRTAIDIIMEAYSRTVTMFGNVVSSRADFQQQIYEAVSKLQLVGRRTIHDVSNGYDYLNEIATALAFFIEDLISSVPGNTVWTPGVRRRSRTGGGGTGRR